MVLCDFCGSDLSAARLKYHRRYICKKNPLRELHFYRKQIFEEMERISTKLDIYSPEFIFGYTQALEWILQH